MSRLVSAIMVGVVMLLVAGCGIGPQPVTTVHDILADPAASIVYPHARIQATYIEDPKEITSVGICCVDHGGIQRLIVVHATAAQIQAWYRQRLLADGWAAAHGRWSGGYCRGNDYFIADTGPQWQSYNAPGITRLPAGWIRVLTAFEIYGHSVCG